MGRLVYTLAIVIVGAAVTHLAIILLLPSTSPNGAGRQLLTFVSTSTSDVIDLSALERSGALTLDLDPSFRTVACGYDLADSPVRVTGGGRTSLWTVSVLNSQGMSIFSANDRISPTPSVDVAVLSQNQLRIFRQTPDPALVNSIIVSADTETGFVVIRMFEPDDSWKELTDAFVGSIQCDPIEGFGELDLDIEPLVDPN